MENKQEYLNDLKEIRDIMDRSSRFISLSGLSGVSMGVLALLGAYLAYQTIYQQQDYFSYGQVTVTPELTTKILAIALGVLVLSLGAGIYFTTHKARKQKQKIWDLQSKRLAVNLLIPLAAGGLVCLVLFLEGLIGLVAPLTLVFYGLALVNASKYTLGDIRSLGIMEILLGLLAIHFIGYGLLFWALGFGILHIVYGVMMYLKYDS